MYVACERVLSPPLYIYIFICTEGSERERVGEVEREKESGIRSGKSTKNETGEKKSRHERYVLSVF